MGERLKIHSETYLSSSSAAPLMYILYGYHQVMAHKYVRQKHPAHLPVEARLLAGIAGDHREAHLCYHPSDSLRLCHRIQQQLGDDCFLLSSFIVTVALFLRDEHYMPGCTFRHSHWSRVA